MSRRPTGIRKAFTARFFKDIPLDESFQNIISQGELKNALGEQEFENNWVSFCKLHSVAFLGWDGGYLLLFSVFYLFIYLHNYKSLCIT